MCAKTYYMTVHYYKDHTFLNVENTNYNNLLVKIYNRIRINQNIIIILLLLSTLNNINIQYILEICELHSEFIYL